MDALCARLAYIRRGRYQVCAILNTRTSSGGMVPPAAVAGAIRAAPNGSHLIPMAAPAQGLSLPSPGCALAMSTGPHALRLQFAHP
jgi:hypothetical protein